jgi:uncharacterized membrane protein
MIDRLINKWNRAFNFNLRQWLIISCLFSCLMVAIRIFMTGDRTYRFMLWNLFLAIIPYVLTEWLASGNRFAKDKLKLLALLFIWLLFIPNSFYILTDLFHLDKFDSAPKWFDLLLIFSFAWNGIILGILSIRKVEVLLEPISGRRFSLFVVFIVMFLNAFGIYIGRYLRFNSWDIIAQPFTLFGEMCHVIFHPLQNKMEWGMITVYAVFMTMLYITIQKTTENFQKLNQQ